jgi:hypothetical protein
VPTPVTPAREPAGEATDVPDIAGDPGGAGRADPVEAQQPGPARLEQLLERYVRRLGLPVDRGRFGGEFGGELPTGPAHHVPRSDRGQQGAGLGGGQELFGATGISSSSSRCNRLTVWVPGQAQFVASVDQQSQCDQVVVGAHPLQAGWAQRDHRDGVRVGDIGLAALPGGEHPCSRGELGRHVEHRLTVGDQPLREVSTRCRCGLPPPRSGPVGCGRKPCGTSSPGRTTRRPEPDRRPVEVDATAAPATTGLVGGVRRIPGQAGPLRTPLAPQRLTRRPAPQTPVVGACGAGRRARVVISATGAGRRDRPAPATLPDQKLVRLTVKEVGAPSCT